ncbi:MAG: polysaccharide deacetylase family protein [Acidobacteria bacterium]|nr:polysaccharide deacetylase family protein [Acidobacteriota bacterium]
MIPIRTVRRTMRWLAACVMWTVGPTDLARRHLRRRGAVVVLALHRVLEDWQLERTNSLSGIVLRRITFSRLAEWLSRRYQVVDLGRGPSGPTPGQLRVAITFDDGWHDTCAVALPVTSALRLPITVFVCPGLLAKDRPFWPERVVAALRANRPGATEAEIETIVEDLKYRDPAERDATLSREGQPEAASHPAGSADRTLSWGQILTMHRTGVTFGAHTQTHQILTAVDEGVAASEIRESRVALESALGMSCALFAYPNGNHSAATRALLADAGFTEAFTMKRGAWMATSDPLAIPRVNLAEDDITGPGGRFSRAMFEYMVFWRVWRTSRASAPAQ